MAYVESKKSAGCVLCEKPGEKTDEANYVLYRAEMNFVIMNSFPYNPGHLMVAPYRHVATLEDLTAAERNEHFDIVSRCIAVLRKVSDPAGFNLGMNIGRVAGAGIEGHIHSHIVPRWNGDTNFLPAIGDTRVIPQALADTYQKLKGLF